MGKFIYSSSETVRARSTLFSRRWIAGILLFCLGLRLTWHETRQLWIQSGQDSTSQPAHPRSILGVCRSPLPPFPKDHLSLLDIPELALASAIADASLRDMVSQLPIDSLVVAVVTSEGPIFERSYGVLKANETDPSRRGSVDKNSIYRIVSISKLFTTLETLVLRDKGLLSLDDPVHKYLPEFSYQADHGDEGPVTIRGLLTHMAGIAGDLPPGDMLNWPHSLDGASTPPYNGLPFPSTDDVLNSQARLPLTNPPYTYPVYSNTAFSILGMLNLAAANKSSDYIGNISMIEELMKRDVFDPLGMNSTGFLATALGVERVAISSYASADADYDFKTSMNPSAGVLSTLSDLMAPIRMLLGADRNPSILSPYTIREWMRPVFPWYDDTTEIGMLWEINKYRNSFGDVQRLYQKSGQLMAYHCEFTVNPASGYGVIVLMTGQYLNAQNPTFQILDTFQPAFDVLAERAAVQLYTGSWSGTTNGTLSQIDISLRNGSLWVDVMILSGTDVLKLLLENPESVALWSTGRVDQFRVAFGESWRNDERGYQCLAYSFGMELGYARGAAINEISFSGEGHGRVLYVPSAALKLHRL
ncbi:beta-lactamase/transpeptidase-like protein [Neolentinus lepideus HHB14362 ss-1]|uniref:Beta-lactamase/transpeptidase-like protein n=1 Tax=Neolentinus lepideus HHB14362 ss-1 TaxID=1314782 RepID=A0A165RB78_9AGAM|nr:beta-lactamase/transpeptidase-like protein [Neolentinus lepideus HHB14362 ss-1]